MSEVRTIESQYGEFRCTLDNAGNIWFVGNDIANILGYKDQKKAIYTHVSINNKTSNTNEMGGVSPPHLLLILLEENRFLSGLMKQDSILLL